MTQKQYSDSMIPPQYLSPSFNTGQYKATFQ